MWCRRWNAVQGVIAAAGIVVLAASPVMAKERHSDPGKQLEFLAKKLELTGEQRSHVERILNDYHARLQSLKEQLESLRSEKDKSIQTVLTPAQQAKFEKMKSARHGRGGWRRGKRSADGQGT